MFVRDALELDALVAAALDVVEMPEAEEMPERRLTADGPFSSGEGRLFFGEGVTGSGGAAGVTAMDAVLSSDEDLKLLVPAFALMVELSGRASGA